MFSDQQVEDAIAAIMDRAQNKAVVVRTVLSMLHTNQVGLAARARGNNFIYAAGRPDDADGIEGDCGINTANGDVYEHTGGQFVFLFNLMPGRGGNFDPFEVPVTLREWVADPVRKWFGPAGGEDIYTAEALPADAVAGMNWDDPDANVEYQIKPVAFANVTVIVCQRKALIAP